MSLPAYRRVNTGRTFSTVYDAASYGAALEKPRPKYRTSDAVFGLLMACVVALTGYVLLFVDGAPK